MSRFAIALILMLPFTAGADTPDLAPHAWYFGGHKTDRNPHAERGPRKKTHKHAEQRAQSAHPDWSGGLVRSDGHVGGKPPAGWSEVDWE
jgi:hypothetical protein